MIQFPDISQRHIGRAMALQAALIGEKPCMLWGTEVFTYAWVNQRVNELAAGLAALGLGRGDRLCFFMGSGPEVVTLALAVNKLGAVWVPINTDYKGQWLEDTIRRSRSTILVTDADHVSRIAELGDRLSVRQVLVAGNCTPPVRAASLAEVYVPGAAEPDMTGLGYGDTCAVLWTSGTTGRSKGVMQSHNVFFNAVELASAPFSAAADDVIYSMLPMYNTAAWVTSIFRALFNGLPLAIDPAFSVTHFWERIDHYRATQTFTLGAMHMFLWNAPARGDDAGHSLRQLMAIPMPPDVATHFAERFDLTLVRQGLGQSEALALCNHNESPDAEPPAASCGRPVPNLQARLVDDNGNDVAPDEVGELWVRPLQPHVVFSGYLDDPQATAAAFDGEWYKTGDMLRCDNRGYYYFSDRKKDAVRYKGRNVSTFEVEMVARSHPAVQDCAAYGIPSAELAEESELKLDVLVAPHSVLTPRALAEYINANAPHFLVPRYLEIVTSLPYTPTNKVQKYKLRQRGLSSATWDALAAGFRPHR